MSEGRELRDEMSERVEILIANVYRLSNERGLSLEEVAMRGHLSVEALRCLRRGRVHDPRLSTVLKLCAGLQATPDEVLVGLTALPPRSRGPAGERQPKGLASSGLNDHASSLTPREREVLDLLINGRSYAQIALQLDVSRTTVISHTRRLQDKLGVGDKHELTRALDRNR